MGGLIASTPMLLPEPPECAHWCLPPKVQSSVGDIVFVYVKRRGIAQIYTIADTNPGESLLECEMRGLRTAALAHVATLCTPLSAGAMKHSPDLRDLAALRRNFQGTVFDLTGSETAAVLRACAACDGGVAARLAGL